MRAGRGRNARVNDVVRPRLLSIIIRGTRQRSRVITLVRRHLWRRRRRKAGQGAVGLCRVDVLRPERLLIRPTDVALPLSLERLALLGSGNRETFVVSYRGRVFLSHGVSLVVGQVLSRMEVREGEIHRHEQGWRLEKRIANRKRPDLYSGVSNERGRTSEPF